MIYWTQARTRLFISPRHQIRHYRLRSRCPTVLFRIPLLHHLHRLIFRIRKMYAPCVCVTLGRALRLLRLDWMRIARYMGILIPTRIIRRRIRRCRMSSRARTRGGWFEHGVTRRPMELGWGSIWRGACHSKVDRGAGRVWLGTRDMGNLDKESRTSTGLGWAWAWICRFA